MPIKSLILMIFVVTAFAQTSPAATSARSKVIETFPTQFANQTIQVKVSKCQLLECPIFIATLINRKISAITPLDWKATNSKQLEIFQKTPSQDLLNITRETGTWFRVGAVDSKITINARPVRISKDKTGVLISMGTGGIGEKIRNYELFAVDKDRNLVRIWNSQHDYDNPSLTKIKIRSSRGLDIIRVKKLTDLRELGVNSEDKWSYQRMVWNSQKNKIEFFNEPTHFAIIRTRKSSKGARKSFKQFTSTDNCLNNFFVLKSDSFPMLNQGYYVVSAPATNKASAERRLKQAISCNPKISGYVKQGQ